MDKQAPEDSILTRYNRNSRIITKFFDKKFRDASAPINSTQYDLLRLIWQNSCEGLANTAEAMGTDRSTISRRMPPMIKAGYAKYVDVNGKKKTPVLTNSGEKLVIKYANVYREADRETIDTLGEQLI